MKQISLFTLLIILTFVFTVSGQKKKKVANPVNKPVVVSQSQKNNQTKLSKLKDVISQAQSLYFEGTSLLAEGKAQQAQRLFNKAKLIVSSAKVADADQPKLAEFFEKLSSSIYLAEFAEAPPPMSVAEAPPLPVNPVNEPSASESLDEKLRQLREKVEVKPIPTPTPYQRESRDYSYTVPGVPSEIPRYTSEIKTETKPANTSNLTIRGVFGNLIFFVLDKSLAKILAESGLNPIVKSKRGRDYDLIETFHKSLNDESSGKYLAFRAEAFLAINKHKVAQTQTNYTGEAKVNLPFGTYYVFSSAWYRTGIGFNTKTIKYVWDKEVTITKDDSIISAGFTDANYIFK